MIPILLSGPFRQKKESLTRPARQEAGGGIPQGRGRRAVRPPVRHRYTSQGTFEWGLGWVLLVVKFEIIAEKWRAPTGPERFSFI